VSAERSTIHEKKYILKIFTLATTPITDDRIVRTIKVKTVVSEITALPMVVTDLSSTCKIGPGTST
jgi:hypothetical protein